MPKMAVGLWTLAKVFDGLREAHDSQVGVARRRPEEPLSVLWTTKGAPIRENMHFRPHPRNNFLMVFYPHVECQLSSTPNRLRCGPFPFFPN